MTTHTSLSKALFSIALMAAFAIAIVCQAASTANAQTAEAKPAETKEVAQVKVLAQLFAADSIKGSYGWNSVAFVNSSTSQPAAGAGLMNFDGAGKLSGFYTGNYLGTPVKETFTGSYLVNPDGSGHLEFVQSNGAVLAYDLFIVSGGAEIFLVSTQPGVLQIVDVKKQ